MYLCQVHPPEPRCVLNSLICMACIVVCIIICLICSDKSCSTAIVLFLLDRLILFIFYYFFVWWIECTVFIFKTTCSLPLLWTVHCSEYVSIPAKLMTRGAVIFLCSVKAEFLCRYCLPSLSILCYCNQPFKLISTEFIQHIYTKKSILSQKRLGVYSSPCLIYPRVTYTSHTAVRGSFIQHWAI